MYHCHIQIYLISHTKRLSEIIHKMSPLEHFTHEFIEGTGPDETLAAHADVILADLSDMGEEETDSILTWRKREKTTFIVLAGEDQFPLLTGYLSQITDIWTMPMSEKEIQFRFLRWQQTYKMYWDFWQTRQFLDTAINNTPNLIWYKDRDGIHKKVNDSFCRTVNKGKKQVEGQKHAYIWDVEQDDPACIESEEEVMRRKETCISEETVKTGDGIRLLTTYKSPLYDCDGSVMGTVGVALDITQERAYEQEVIEKNHTLEMIFTTMDCGVICHSIDGSRILSINRAALEILGYDSQEEMIEKGFDTVAMSVLDEDKPKLRKCIEELKREGDNVSVEYRVQHKNGEIRNVMGNVKLVEKNGQLFYQRFLLDCTTQKLQEEKRQREKEKRHMELIQALSIDYNFVCYFDLDTGKGAPLRIEKDNFIVHSVFDKDVSLLDNLEHYIQNYVYKEDREILRRVASQDGLRKELADNNQFYLNYRGYNGDYLKYYQMKVVRIGIQDGSQGIVVGFRSVDEEIRNEMEKKNLLEDALLQANRANKAKSVFLSNMSHDIRTPMNAIVGFTTLAINHIDQKEQVEEYLKKIKSSGNHLLSLINDVLDMSRIESGKMHLEEKPCSLSAILNDLRTILQADIQAKHLNLQIEITDIADEEIYCDKLRLNQVLLNLLSNSVKYTEEGGAVSIKLTEKPDAPAGCARYEFRITDTGIGMSEEFVKHIFEPFERERNSTISGIQGTGLGMAITKNIVEMMNGSIDVSSKQGVGTEFVVSFIFRLNPEMNRPEIIPEFKDSKVLVVADSSDSCQNISHMLEQMGMKSEWALLGEEALQHTREAIAAHDSYPLYVIDETLPDMNGIEIIQKIRAMGEEMPVVILVSYDWSDIEEEAKAAGVTAFCRKPLFMSELQECLGSLTNVEESGVSEEPERSVQIHKGRILLAEDIPLNQEIAVTILNEAGFETEVAEDGHIAVNMVKQSEPGYYQLVLMDIQMPSMNGYEATKQIRKLENKELASIPILAMSANAFEEDKQMALKCGMNGHIAKPIDIKVLFDTLEKVLYEQ